MSIVTDRDLPGRFLIGPRLYDAWWRLLLTVCGITAPVVGAIAVVASVGSGGTFGEVIWAGLAAAIAVAVQCAFWVTLVVAGIERFAPARPVTAAEQLPQRSTTRPATGGASALTATIATSAITLFLMVWQQIASPFHTGDTPVPILDPALWMPWLAGVAALLVVNVIVAIRAHVAGWTWPLAGANAIRAAAFAGILAPLLLGDRLLNPQLAEVQSWGAAAAVSLIIALGVIAVALWEAANGFIGATRKRDASQEPIG